MAQHRQRRNAAGIVGALVVVLAITGGAVAATPVSGSVDGPVASVTGSTFTVTTSLSPTGKSSVVLSSKARITKEESAPGSALRDGTCVLASGTAKGSSVAATRIVLRSSCSAPTGGLGGARPGGGTPGGAGGARPANFALATGTITAVSGSTLTVKGATSSTSVIVSSSTQLERTVTVKAAAITVSECAFVHGTSSDGGVKVTADSVSLSAPTKSGCSSGFPRS